jgi:hypothetical protein
MEKETYVLRVDQPAGADRRIWIQESSSSSAFFDNIPTVDKRVRHDGSGSISFGGPAMAEWQWGKNKGPQTPTFYDVEYADALYQTVLRLQDQARRAVATSQSRWPS